MQWVGNSLSPATLSARRLSRGRAERHELISRAGWTGIGGPTAVNSELGAVAKVRRDGPGVAPGSAHRTGQSRLPVSEAPHGANGKIKRRCDFALALIALLMLLPVFAVVAIAVTLESPGPVFFWQWRGGQNGRKFQIVKFRTMHCIEDGDQVRQVARGDARVTRVGRVLRKTSIDELPQLFNVLRGDMSLVGPRPHALAHDAIYSGLITGYVARQVVKPGLTGWAQVNGCRGETRDVAAMQRRIRRDLAYIRHWSLWLDFAIMIRTVNELVRSDKAY
jgi:putative colanic acid biosysnthesis UDP-glucose lipid carrier transferase